MGEKTRTYLVCKCDCGAVKEILKQSITSKVRPTTSCAKYCPAANRKYRSEKIKDLTGQRFGSLTAIQLEYTKKMAAFWRFKCDCGTEKVTRGRYAVLGKLVKCSKLCPLLDHPTSSVLYRRWAGIKSRCLNPKDPAYHRYGGRGIIICEEWRDSFQDFEDYCYSLDPDLETKIKNKFEIDRINNNGNYEPGNIRFVNHKVNCNNRESGRINKNG